MSTKKNILCLGGSRNQTSQLHQIAQYLEADYNIFYSQVFGEGFLFKAAAEIGFFDNTVLGRDSSFTKASQQYIKAHNLNYDYRGQSKGIKYDLALLSTDMIVPKSFKNIKTVWIQEGMIDPITSFGRLVKKLGLPAYATASTALNGTSNKADLYFAMSRGYKNYFKAYGTESSKILVTGVPNFDNIHSLMNTSYNERGFVLVATSDIRELGGNDDRIFLIKEAIRIANGRKLIFKPHPNESIERVISEIKSVHPNPCIITEPIIDILIAHCDVLITQYSSCVYQGLVLGKKVYSYFPIEELEIKKPIQNGGKSGKIISGIVSEFMEYTGDKNDFIKTSQSVKEYL